MRRAHVFLSLALAVVWLGNGVGPAASPQGTGDSMVRAMGPAQVPAGLTPSEWQGIQAQVAKLTATDGRVSDKFGISVSIDDDTGVVGAFGVDVGDNADQGAAYVFYRNQGGTDAWGQATKLTAADGHGDSGFGVSVSVGSDTAIVGASGADVGGNADQGAAYVFYRNQGGPDAWGQAAKLTATDGAAGDYFGISVSVSGDTAVVGAYQAAVGGYSWQGAAYVFYRNLGGPDAWGQVTKLTTADGTSDDFFGISVSVDGDTAVVGARDADAGGHAWQGAAYVFYRNQGGPNAWGQVVKLAAADGAELDSFGASVSVSGDTTVVGAGGADVGGHLDQGAAYVFYRNQDGPDAWGQVAKLTAVDGAAYDWLGCSVSVGSDTAVVGTEGADVGGNADQGAAYIFYRNQGRPDTWGQATKLIADDAVYGDHFGHSVSISDATAIIGVYRADVGGNADQGAAYVYAVWPMAWDDVYTTAEDTLLQVSAALGVLANDLNPNGDPVNAVLDTGPSHGTLDLHADGSFTYTPTAGFVGLDTFTYHANDGTADSNVATVQITVTHCIYLPLVVRNG